MYAPLERYSDTVNLSEHQSTTRSKLIYNITVTAFHVNWPGHRKFCKMSQWKTTKSRSHILIQIDTDVGVRSHYIMHFFLQNHQYFFKYSTYKEQVNTKPSQQQYGNLKKINKEREREYHWNTRPKYEKTLPLQSQLIYFP